MIRLPSLLQTRLPILPVDPPQGDRDLPERDLGPYAVEDGRHEVAVLLGGGGEGLDGRGGASRVPPLPQGSHA